MDDETGKRMYLRCGVARIAGGAISERDYYGKGDCLGASGLILSKKGRKRTPKIIVHPGAEKS